MRGRARLASLLPWVARCLLLAFYLPRLISLGGTKTFLDMRAWSDGFEVESDF